MRRKGVYLFINREQETASAADGQTALQLVLVLGGARSGKSAFAQRLAAESGRRVAFIATATASDDDMRERILRHRAARPVDWYTLEEPLELAAAVEQSARVADVLVLDCVTVWLSNWLFAQEDVGQIGEPAVHARYNDEALAEIEKLLSVCAALDATKTLVVVSNEVGLGIVPAYELGRVYRDVLGRINQRLAMASARVYLMIAGLGVDLKRLHEEASL